MKFFPTKTLLVWGFGLVYFIIFLLMLAHLILARSYFHGAPTQEIEYGQVLLGISLVVSLITVYFGLFIQVTNRRSMPTFCCLHIGFVISILTSFVVIYFFRSADPTLENVGNYTSQYFKMHRKPPPFFEKIQNVMNGYCCGAMSYLDYVDSSPGQASDMFDVPRSCCFGQLRSDVDCGGKNWKYLYMFLASMMPEMLTILEKHYDYLDDLETVVKNVATANSRHFLDFNYEPMVDDRVASLKLSSGSNSNTYQQMIKQTSLQYPNLPLDQINEIVSRELYDVAQKQIMNLTQQITDPWAMKFVPVGCWSLLTEMRTSKWPGFNQLKEVKEKVTFMVEGALAMACLYSAALIIFVAIFYITIILGYCDRPSKKSPPNNMNEGEPEPGKGNHGRRGTGTGTADQESEIDADAEAVRLLPKQVSEINNRKHRNELVAEKIHKLRAMTMREREIQSGNETEVSGVSDTEEEDELHKLLSSQSHKTRKGSSSK